MRLRRAVGFVFLLAAALAVMALFACGGKIAPLDEGPPLAAGTSTAPPSPSNEDGDVSPDASTDADGGAEPDADADVPNDVVFVPLPPLDANILPQCVDFHRDADNGAPSSEYPAFHPTMPEIVPAGGPTMTAPILVPVTFAVDRYGQYFVDFVQRLPATEWWKAIAAEYGIGPVTVVPGVVTDTPNFAYDDGQVVELLYRKATGASPVLPPPTPNTLYVVFLPPGTRMDDHGCSSYHFHWEPAGKPPITYAVIPNCGGYAGLRNTDAVTARTSRTIVAAVADPTPIEAPGWTATDFDHYMWAYNWGSRFLVLPLAEPTDLCTSAPFGHAPYVFQPPDIAPYWVERVWSNSASLAQHFPCGPPSEPYFAATAVLKDKVWGTINPGDIVNGVKYFHTRGLVVPPMSCRHVEIDLQSDRDLGEPIQVEAYETVSLYPRCNGNCVNGPSVFAHWDRKSGYNGEKLHLTVEIRKSKAVGYSAILLAATAAGRTTYWPVVFGNTVDHFGDQ